MSALHNSIESKKKELEDSSNNVKQELISAFEDIRQRLNRKEKELLDSADVYLQEHLQELNTYTRVINSKVIALNRIIDNINSHRVRNDEVSLLNYYSDNHEKVVQQSQADMPEIPDVNTIYAMRVSIDPSTVEKLISNLSGIHAEIATLKGHEIHKINNPQKFIMKREMYGLNADSRFSPGQFNTANTLTNKNIGGGFSHDTSYDFSRNNLVS